MQNVCLPGCNSSRKSHKKFGDVPNFHRVIVSNPHGGPSKVSGSGFRPSFSWSCIRCFGGLMVFTMVQSKPSPETIPFLRYIISGHVSFCFALLVPNSAYVSEPKKQTVARNFGGRERRRKFWAKGQFLTIKKISSHTVEEILHQFIGRYFMLLFTRIF